jgi:excisionase family DNA binding protein
MEANRPQLDPSPQPPARRRLTRDDVMTAAEVAGVLAMPKSTVYELARRGELPCARLGRTVRFLRDDVEARLRGAQPSV